MIYLILYAIKLPNGKTLGGFYYAWANSFSEADKIFMSIGLSTECFRKEIWSDDGKGYRKLIKIEEYDYEKNALLKKGDTFYRSTDKINIPDRLEVLDILEHDGRTLIRAKYMYRTIGPVFERTFDAKIFEDPKWVIEKRKERTA